MDKYEFIQKIGEGAYGKVYKAVDKSTGQLVAVKKTVIESDEGVPPTTIREVRSWWWCGLRVLRLNWAGARGEGDTDFPVADDWEMPQRRQSAGRGANRGQRGGVAVPDL